MGPPLSWRGGAEKLHFAYEARPCGYGLYRQLVESGHACDVVSPAHTPNIGKAMASRTVGG